MVFTGGNINWTVRDNVFDALLVLSDEASPIDSSYNAYNNVANTLTGSFNDLILTNLSYQTGSLGKYYQSSGSPLINFGSRAADFAGLYHFTTTTNQVKETNSLVDIGLHYVALNGQGQPMDSNADGVPDYQSDISGNGMSESGEIVWYPLPPFNVIITVPNPNAVLP